MCAIQIHCYDLCNVNTNIEKFWNVIKSEQFEYLHMVLSIPHPFTYLVEDIRNILLLFFSLAICHRSNH